MSQADPQNPPVAVTTDPDPTISSLPAVGTAEPPTEPSAPTTVPEPMVTAPESVEPEHWRMESWKGLPKWQCNYCGFSTMKGEDDIAEHVQGRHLAPSKAKGASGLVGPNGDAL